MHIRTCMCTHTYRRFSGERFHGLCQGNPWYDLGIHVWGRIMQYILPRYKYNIVELLCHLWKQNFFHVETCKILILKWTRINRMVQTRRYRDNLKRVKKKEIALEKWYIMKITPCWERRRTYMPSRWVKE